MSPPAQIVSALRWLRRLAPWVVALALLIWVFSHVPMEAFGEALVRGHFAWFVPSMLVLMVFIYLADCFAITKTFTWFTVPMRFREVLRIRGASYLLSVLNYNLGQGAFVVFAKHAKGLSYALGTGTVLFLMGTNLLVILLFATVALSLGAAPRAATLWPWVTGLLVALGLYLAVVGIRPARLLRVEILRPLFNAGLRGHMAALLVRLPHLVLVMLAHYLAMLAFDIRPPVDVFFAYLPVMLLISALPVAPQGLGTAQVAAIYFFAAYAPGDLASQKATALAYSLTASATAMLFMLFLGLIWFRSGLRLLGLRSDAASPPPQEASEP